MSWTWTTLMPVIDAATKSGLDILSVSQDLSPVGIASIMHDNAGGAAAAVAHLVARGSDPDRLRRAHRNLRRRPRPLRRLSCGASRPWPDARPDPGLGHFARAIAPTRATRPRLRPWRTSFASAPCWRPATSWRWAAWPRRPTAALRVPDDIAFVGFGGLGWGAFSRPSMTTVSLDADAVARAVGEIFKARDGGPSPPSRQIIPTKLVLRQSA